MECSDLIQCHITNASLGYVDNTIVTEIIIVVVCKLEIPKYVIDFNTVKEPVAANLSSN